MGEMIFCDGESRQVDSCLLKLSRIRKESGTSQIIELLCTPVFITARAAREVKVIGVGIQRMW